MEEQSATVNVTQERVTETCTVGGTFDQSGNVSRHKSALAARANNTEVGGEGGKVIVRDLRLCRRNARKNRRFTNTGVTDKTHVGNHFQFQNNLAFLTLCAIFGEHRNLTRRCCKVTVAPTAATAAAGDKVSTVVL